MTYDAYHLYPQETLDVFLRRSVLPFLEEQVWVEGKNRAFFIRYADEKGEHIRLRLRGMAWDELVFKHFEGRGTITKVPYDGETERYGGEMGLFLCENQFDLSSRISLARLGKDTYTYGDAMFDALRLDVALLGAAGLERKRIKWYFQKLYEMWLPHYFRQENGSPLDEAARTQIVAAFEQSYQQQETALMEALDATWMALADQDFPTAEPEWAQWYKGNKIILDELGVQADKVLPSLVHLTHNRLGINNQDEVFLCYMLAQAL